MERKKWYYRMPAKTAIFLALVINAVVLIVSALGCCGMWTAGFYTASKDTIVEDMVFYTAQNEAYRLYSMGKQDQLKEEPYYLVGGNCMYVYLDKEGTVLYSNYDGRETKFCYTYNNTYGFGAETGSGAETLVLYVDESFSGQDRFAFRYHVVSFAYEMRYLIVPLIGISMIVSVICFVFLMCSAGHRGGKEEITQGVFVRLPLEIYGGILLTGVILLPLRTLETWVSYGDTAQVLAIGIGTMLVILPVLIAICMNFAVRIKCGSFWRNTLTWRLLRFLKKLFGTIRYVITGIFQAMPLMWKSVILLTGVFCVEFVLILTSYYYGRYELGVKFVMLKAVEFIVILYFVMSLNRLKKGGKALAEGDLTYQIDEKGLILDFKEHARNLNSIADGMTTAVNERMKSERMKTELITNVSHDIKTPLTSIVNYSDLIVKEQSENEKINEYAQVLARQSVRLKKLIEDLVEASKASTGNLDVTLEPMEIGVMLVQVTGEYTERLKEKELTLITKQPEEPIMILADGRRLWRVIDNLLNNVCKYSQEGTRVYLTVEQWMGWAVVTLKNTSKYALDIPAEELMGRFVRGDESRSTEGNGLGLSIAQSLTELQKGTMELVVDGDLFKVILRFPVLE